MGFGSATASERIVYYSAEEEAEGVVPEQQEEDTTPARLLRPKARAGPGTGGDGSAAKAVEKKKAKPTVALVAAALEDIAKVLPTLTSRVAELDSRTSGLVGVPSGCCRWPDDPALERVSALRKPLSAAVPISGQVLPAGALLSKMPPPRPCSHKAVVESANTARLEAQELTLERQLEDPNANMDLARAVLAQSNALTGLVGQLAQGGDSMADLSTSWTSGLSTKGACWEGEVATGALPAQGCLFQICHPSYGPSHAPFVVSGLGAFAVDGEGGFPLSLHGEVRGVWPGEGYRPDCLASSFDNGSLAARELEGGSGCYSFVVGVPGTDCSRFREDGCGSFVGINRRPAKFGVHKPNPSCQQSCQSFRASSRSTMDYNCFELSPGVGPDHESPIRVCWRRSCTKKRRGSGSRSCPKTSSKKEAKRRLEEVSPRSRRGRMNAWSSRTRHEAPRCGPASPPIDAEASISFLSFAAALPRWIVATNTPFAAFLATPSVVFPLPILECGLFAGSGPRLRKKAWTTLVRKKALAHCGCCFELPA